MRLALLTLFVILLAGCSPKPDEAAIAKPIARPIQTQSGIAPIGSGAAGGITPVTGSETLEGGMGGIGQAMKDKARGTASTESNAPLPTGD
jgi:hypothetical protein